MNVLNCKQILACFDPARGTIPDLWSKASRETAAAEGKLREGKSAVWGLT